ncbi:MAG: DUF790 family protein [Candidatus Methanomethylicia archaeon]
MLPSSLLRVRRVGVRIYPVFAGFSYSNLYIADQLINLFKLSIGKTLGELQKSLEDLEIEFCNLYKIHYKLYRGLLTILLRRVKTVKPKTPINPIAVRMMLFKASNMMFKGAVLTDDERRKVIEYVAGDLGISTSEVEKCFDAVYEENEVIEGFEDLDSETLLKQYNLSLTQTLLFKSLKLNIESHITGSEAKRLLWNVKRLGLLYFAEKIANGLRISIDGPASIIRSIERYGTLIAKLIPYIVSLKSWIIEAEIRGKKRSYKFTLTSSQKKLFPQLKQVEEAYDSSLEEDFARRFNSLNLGWKLVREPEPLIANGSIFIPDFAALMDDVKIYIEIVGFWTPEYLKRKIEKLRMVKGVNMIVAADESLSCSSIANIPHEVILFKNRLSPVDVLLALRKYEKPRKTVVDLTKPIIKLKNLDSKTPIDRGYKVVGRLAVKKDLVEIIDKIVKELNGKTLAEAIDMLRKVGIEDMYAIDIIEAYGFKVKWHGLEGIVEKGSSNSNI